MTTQTSRYSAHSSGSAHSASRKPAPMSSKNSSRSSGHQSPDNALGALNVLTELGRQQMAVATESVGAMYRASEALRKVQQETAHEASVHHEQAAHKLFSPCQPADIVAVQAELMRTNIQSATHYWQQCMQVALQAQREMMLSMGHLLDGESGSGMKSAMKAFQASIPPMATSFFIHSPDESSEPH